MGPLRTRARRNNCMLEKGNVHSTCAGMIAMALSAQGPEETRLAYSVAKNYSNSSAWNNWVKGAAMLALGILAADDREKALKIAAASIELIQS